MIASPLPVHAGQLRTDFIRFPSRKGGSMAACLDHAGDLRGRPWVVIAPKYGETKKNSLQLAYYLAANGVNVLRFDLTDHVGESEGSMERFTLPGAVEDIAGAFDYLEREHGVVKAGLLANSLSARMAVRAAAQDLRVAYLVSLVGVVNVRRTLQTVYQEDVVANYLAGHKRGKNDVLGFDIEFEHFLGALIESGLHSIEGTAEDLSRIQAPVLFISAAKDAWVDPEDVKAVVARAPRGECRVVRDAMHEVRENPEAAERAFRELVASCATWSLGVERTPFDIQVPDKRVYLKQNKIERDRFRKTGPAATDETEFWSKYLGKYEYFESVDVYHYYLNLIGDLLGPIRPGETVLDAGCGNGLFGVWAIRKVLEQQREPLDPPALYVGLDLTHRGLLDALGKHRMARESRPSEMEPAPIGCAYLQMDLDRFGASAAAEEGLVDFAPGTFDKICCSLLISYLREPQRLLHELHRVLKPGGKLVITSLKPFADLSDLYRRYVEKHDGEREVESARDLLRAAGKIKVREEQGYYTFFSGEELCEALQAAGFGLTQPTMGFGNQASVVLAVK